MLSPAARVVLAGPDLPGQALRLYFVLVDDLSAYHPIAPETTTQCSRSGPSGSRGGTQTRSGFVALTEPVVTSTRSGISTLGSSHHRRLRAWTVSVRKGRPRPGSRRGLSAVKGLSFPAARSNSDKRFVTAPDSEIVSRYCARSSTG